MCLSACGSMDLEPARLLCPWGFPGKISSSRGSSQPKDLNPVSCISRWILYHGVTWEALFLGQITFYACKCLFVQFGFLYFPLFWSKRKSESVICSAMSDSLRPQGLGPTRLLCPWDFPGNNTRVGCNFLLQGIFVTQGSNPCLLCLGLADRFFTTSVTYVKLKLNIPQSCPALCNLMDCTVHGILQARILEWVAFPFFRGSLQPGD